ncbi:glycoside hydrolase family 3 C-terminal domain-containing protein [Sporofaciens sp. JLR.KK001]|uniref:glycoside hydrolase family 3 C-terminal domain-containing protein n=1 Tax=Sporofaciens sp. JLR.KK001 TaxID=3112621 RepID=UPI002FF09072
MGNYRKERAEARKKAKELVSKMTLMEKAAQLRYDAAPVSRLGVPTYNYWNEALHGVARAGVATMFPQAIGMAAAFDEDAMERVGDIIATEGRAKYNEYSKHDDRDIYKGLTFWSPNVNIFRDPRWGRGHETYGEDPYLTSRLGVRFVEGIQGGGPVMKAAACAKHYAVHSGPEAIRHEFDAEVSMKDMWETYLPAFEALVKEADVEAVMGAYNRTNGEPCCGHKYLMEEVLRGKWEFDGHYTSDCWAIKDFHENHQVTKNARESAALALKCGCDVNCGNTYLHLLGAVEDGLITEEDITVAAERLLTSRFLMGLFDGSEYDDIPYEAVECREHLEEALNMARKGSVLLKNDGALPLDKSKLKTIGVVGPNADSRAALIGNYHGTASRYITVLEGIQDEVGDDVRVLFSEGCHLEKDRVENLAWSQDRISEAVITAEHSDVVIICVGLDETLEGEEGDAGNSDASGDKKDLHLPKVQEELIEEVTAVGKPTIVVLMAGSAIDLNYAEEHCNAVLMAWYPGARGGRAVADILFGNVSPSGKLPVTFYKGLEDLPEFTDYSMKNRTYRYMEQEALYPFGYGLTYGDAEVKEAKVSGEVTKESDIRVEVFLKNEGDTDTDEVVQIYIKDLDSKLAVPNYNLCAFKRISLKAGEEKKVEMTVPNRAMSVVDEEGERHIDSKNFKLFAGFSQPDERSRRLTGKETVEIPVTLR